MALSVSSSTSTGEVMNNWMDFYVKDRNDNGPIQNLFGQNLEAIGRITLGHLNDTNALTETIVGTSCGNMMMFPGKSGTMQIAHQGFGASTGSRFYLNCAQGNLEDCTIFKSIPRADVVAPIGSATRTRSGLSGIDCPTLDEMMDVESEAEFAAFAAIGNGILQNFPNHAMITPQVFS